MTHPGVQTPSTINLSLIWLLRLAGFALAAGAIVYGLRLRNDVWTWSAPIRFTGDIGNALGQGSAVLDEASAMARSETKAASGANIPTPLLLRAFLRRYEIVIAQANNEQYGLDYTPARLLIMSFWARYVRRIDPGGKQFAQQDAAPLLRFNTGCDLAAAAIMFALVRLWVGRSRGTGSEWGWLLGLIAALISWFNPSTLLDAHMWPQWDVWIVPFYLAAIYLASVEWWFGAGMSLAIGALFKGQLLMVAPVMVLWPLFSGRWLAVVRIVIGFFFAAALAASPWLARNIASWIWVGTVLLLCMILLLIANHRPTRLRSGRRMWPIWSAIPICALAAVPFGLSDRAWMALAVALFCTPWLVRILTWRGSAIWLAAIASACIFLSANAFSGTWAWYTVGYAYPTRHYPTMANGSCNLAGLLGARYHWQTSDLVGHLWRWDITMKSLLIIIYSVSLILCAVGAVLHDRRRDARLLISLTAPWVLMFAILPQMHERYLMWAAALCGVAVASSTGMSLMHLIVIGLSFSIIGQDLFPKRPALLPNLTRFVGGINPGIGWMVVLGAAVYLFAALSPGRDDAALRGSD